MITALVLTLFQQQLLGHWKQCLAVSASSSIGYQISFSETSYVSSSAIFRSMDCSGLASSTQNFSGSYELGQPVSEDTYQINYHREEPSGLADYYDIIKIQDGKSWGGVRASTSAEQRPTEINSHFWMEKDNQIRKDHFNQ